MSKLFWRVKDETASGNSLYPFKVVTLQPIIQTYQSLEANLAQLTMEVTHLLQSMQRLPDDETTAD